MAHVTGMGQRPLSGRTAGSTTGVDAAMQQAMWFLAVCGIAFLIPFTFTTLFSVQHDWYYLLYFAATLATLGAYVKANDIDVVGAFTRNWKLSLAVGAVSTAFVVWSVLARVDSTPHPTGAYFVFEILWRGVLYGVVDALLLSALPGLVAWKLMHQDIGGLARRASYAGITLLLVIFITAAYHLGYQDLRNREGIGNPEIGNTAISLPVMLSANPLGSVIAHTSMHVAAVTHSYESKDRLPPQVFVDSHGQ